MDPEGTDMKPALETILHLLHALALLPREAGICITWYEPNEMRSLGPSKWRMS